MQRLTALIALAFCLVPLACSDNDDERVREDRHYEEDRDHHYDDDDRGGVSVNVQVNRGRDDDPHGHRPPDGPPGYHVHAIADPQAQLAGTILESTPDGQDIRLHEAPFDNDGRFHFEQESVTEGAVVHAHFWSSDPQIEPLIIPLEPGRPLDVEITLNEGRLALLDRQPPPAEYREPREYSEHRATRRGHGHGRDDDDDDDDDDDRRELDDDDRDDDDDHEDDDRDDDDDDDR